MFKSKFARVMAVGASLAVAASSSFAAIDTSVSTAFAAVQTDAIALSAIVVPIVVGILGLGITIKLIKRFGNKL